MKIRRIVVPAVVSLALLAGQLQATGVSAQGDPASSASDFNDYAAVDQTAVESDEPAPETASQSRKSADMALMADEWHPNFGLHQFMESTAVSPADATLNTGTTPLLVQTATGNLYEAPTQYNFVLCKKYHSVYSAETSCRGSSIVAISGWTTSASWRVPAGTLAANSTYTWTALSRAGFKTDAGYGTQDSNWFSTGPTADGVPALGDAIVKQSAPATATYQTTLTPTFSARTKLQTPGINTYVRYFVKLCAQPICLDQTQVADSGWRLDRSWTIPAGPLYWGGIYAWTVQVGMVNPDTGVIVASDGDLNPRIFATSIPLPPADHLGLDSQSPIVSGVNLFDRHYEYSVTDAAVITGGAPLSVARQYSSSNTRTGTAFGPGWSSILDTALIPATQFTGYYVRLADGHEVAFGRNSDGSYAPAPGSEGMFLGSCSAPCAASDLAFTDQTGTKFVFSNGRLIRTIDSDLREHAFVYDANGKLVKIVDTTSSRALGFSWSQGRVLQVTIEPAVAGVPSTWNYSYRGDRLVSVCAAETRDGCMTYTYGTTTPFTLRAVIAPNGTPTQEVTYDGTGRVASSVSTAGYVTSFTRAPGPNSGQLVTMSEASGLSSTYTLDSFGRNTQYTTSAGADERWTYDNQGRLLFYANAVTDAAMYLEYQDGQLYSRAISRAGQYDIIQMFAYISADGPAKGKLWLISDGPQEGWHSTPDAAQSLHEFEYDSQGRLSAEHFGRPGATRSTTRYTYTAGTESTCGSSTTHPPAGLLKTQTDPAGKVSSRVYTSAGQLCDDANPVGAHTAYAYDELGRVTSKSQSINSATPTLVESYAYGRNGLLATLTTPTVADTVTGQSRRLVTTMAYDNNYNLTTSTQTDTVSGQNLVTSYVYDQHNHVVSTTEPDDAVTTKQYDLRGNVTSTTSPSGDVTAYEYSPSGKLTKTTALGYVNPVEGVTARNITVESRTYDGAGRLATLTNRAGLTTKYEYYRDDLVHKITALAQPVAGGGTADVVLSDFTYDQYGNATSVSRNNGRTVQNDVYDAKSQLTSSTVSVPAVGSTPASTRTTSHTYDLRGLVLTESVGPSATSPVTTTSKQYDDAGRLIKSSVGTTATSTDQASTYYKLNLRGDTIGVTDPLGASAGDTGHTTDYAYDLSGNVITETAPPANTGATRAVTKQGYDSFGRQSLTVLPDGSRIARTFDAVGRTLTETAPYLVAPAGGPSKTQYTYSPTGHIASTTDRSGVVTTNVYDSLDQVASVTRSARLPGEASRTWTTQYSDAGNPVTSTTPTGAVTSQNFNTLGQVTSSTTSFTGPDASPLAAITTYEYDIAGNLTAATRPTGGKATYRYDVADELVSQTDPDGGSSSFAYGYLGNVTRATDPLGNVTLNEYDPRGNQTAKSLKTSSGTLVNSWNWTFDKADNPLTQTDPRAKVRTVTYDALSRAKTFIDENSATTALDYDPRGNLTKYTDPRNNITTATYTPEQRVATLTEPSTAAFPNAADRTTTWQYDTAGRLSVLTNPGGSTVTTTYDGDDNITSETAVNQGRTDVRTFSFDDVDRLVAFSHPSGTQAVAYNEIGWVTSSSGPAGDSEFAYDLNGNLTQRTDAAGTMTATWTPGDRPATVQNGTDPVVTSTYNVGAQLTKQTWGALATRNYTYTAAGDPASDITKNTAGTVLASTSYTRDAAGNILTRTVAPATIAGAGTTTYTYDAGQRLTAWKTPDTVNHSNVWDAAGNATTLDGAIRAFDARNRLTNGNGSTFTYNARGDLTNTTGAATRTLGYDAFSQLIQNGTQTHTYDALSRLATTNTDTFSYAGTSQDVAAVGTSAYGRDPEGLLASTNGAFTISNTHGDVTTLIGQNLALTSSTYAPTGTPTLSSGSTALTIGFQGDYTSGNGLVNMQARWYDPTLGVFTTRDTIPFGTDQQNRYAYGNSNPINQIDPTGHTSADIAARYGWQLPSIGAVLGAAGGWIARTAPRFGPLAVAAAPIAAEALFWGGLVVGAAGVPILFQWYLDSIPHVYGPSSGPSSIGGPAQAGPNAPGSPGKPGGTGGAQPRFDWDAWRAQQWAEMEAQVAAAAAERAAQLLAIRNQPITPTETIVEGMTASLAGSASGFALCGAALSGGACTASASSLGAGCAGLGANTAIACLPSAVDVWNQTDGQTTPTGNAPDDTDQPKPGPQPGPNGGGLGSGGGIEGPGAPECHPDPAEGYGDSPYINPQDIAGKSPAEIDQIARSAGLIPMGPDPMNGRGSYVDPITNKERVLIHPNDKGGRFAHVNDLDKNRLDVCGEVVPDNSPGAHLPLGDD
ncbi:RHS repeat-associated core domain-containing protein [Herbiconiux sp. P16]|uniref:RHS repeat-associated core domain-containing protein n=1 Tax=Herbiconiux wuyangfengii TaxID=3342794 RepID=UPI0035BB2B83